ncbi:restriction endonuclease [Pseudomonas mosselii]|uniref:restriction endonuclease n=1 Tax=Pseudomonas mosselii TaxID=78327 RepID=UPI0018D86CD1|nr:restriction endonuclease [Pseudomonas mosselii]MBH3325404.1 restriction endonuclease [Pseudomonas mosselii]
MSVLSIRGLSDLTPTEFENLTLDLVVRLGLKNAVWRTPGRDGGRDIQGDSFISDFSGFVSRSSWYVECKRYADTVSWPNVWEKISYADSNSADVLLVVTTSTLSPQAIDEVNRWNLAHKNPSVRFWNRQDVEARLGLHLDIKVKYGLSQTPIQDAALSMIELSKVLLKYSNSITACVEFSGALERRLDVVQTLSELIGARLAEIEQYGRISVIPFRPNYDAPDWLKQVEVVQGKGFDRYAFRCIAALIHCHSSANEVIIADASENKLTLHAGPVVEELLPDLKTIAFWGGLNIASDSNSITIESQYAAN